ncbi:VOC family protein [Streptomyces sp. N35]|uniref:VOC family protein n=1 Tax=Streptomyces sp. N35 TaxID=2795730 RepID=UPI0018F3C5BC|nr:VOC family protein [Streptomyces sp. N35]
MTLHWKLVIDAEEPRGQADFWAAALGYELEDHSALIGQLLAGGAVTPEEAPEWNGRPAFRDYAAVRHPDDPFDAFTGMGEGRRLLFQRVPEKKTVKNRLHLDVHTAEGRDRDEEVARLEALGARELYRIKEPIGEWVTMADPEGNEFCVE